MIAVHEPSVGEQANRGKHDGPSIVATMRAARQAEINELLEELRQAKHDAAEIIGLAVEHVNSVHERLAEALERLGLPSGGR